MDYAEELAQHDIAAYCFDFRGGGGNRSDGNTTEMSVMTEVSDLETIIIDAVEWDFVDDNRIILFGESQGGIVSAITAARHNDEVAGLILAYPAFFSQRCCT
ncbi:MAG: lysophospholipase [Clostridium sp.]|nr:lysophospholipase [Clostridium sp.]